MAIQLLSLQKEMQRGILLFFKGGLNMATGYLEWKMMKNDMEADDVPGAYHFNEWYDEEQVW